MKPTVLRIVLPGIAAFVLAGCPVNKPPEPKAAATATATATGAVPAGGQAGLADRTRLRGPGLASPLRRTA
ncbi:hypothetical protein WG922_19855 [Ramlibacter sp. AN1015]|uniref:hypothetical protein n=1 Tax=Ramlibacter sp. AN1015 TaxID=3133428 RepID=UPI0030C32962